MEINPQKVVSVINFHLFSKVWTLKVSTTGDLDGIYGEAPPCTDISRSQSTQPMSILMIGSPHSVVYPTMDERTMIIHQSPQGKDLYTLIWKNHEKPLDGFLNGKSSTLTNW